MDFSYIQEGILDLNHSYGFKKIGSPWNILAVNFLFAVNFLGASIQKWFCFLLNRL